MFAWAVIDFLQRNWALVSFVLTLATLIIVPALILRKYVRISLNIMRTTKPPLARNPLDFVRLVGDEISFTAHDGLRLSGMLIRANPLVARRGIVIFAHEFCSDMFSCARYCRPLQEAGYDVFTFDFRNHGASEHEEGFTPRQWVTDREISDMRGAVAWVERWLEEQGFEKKIGIFGISRGACAAILHAVDNPSIRAIVSDGGYSTDRTIEYFMKRWAYIFATVRVVYENHPPAFWRFLRWLMMHFARREFRTTFPSVRKALQKLTPRAMLFIHGERDSYLPVEQSRYLYALAPQPKYLWVAPKARHNQAAILHPERYARLTRYFFDQHLGEVDTPTVLPTIPTAARNGNGAAAAFEVRESGA